MLKLILTAACILLVTAPMLLAQATTKPSRSSKVILGYSATWRDVNSPPEFYNYDAVTHIARSFLIPHADGSISVPTGFFNDSLETAARAHHVKLLVSIGGESDTADHWVAIGSNAEKLDNFCNQLDKLITDHHYDGVDIDWEPSPLTDAAGAAYTTMLKKLRERFPKWIITTALPPSDYWTSHFDWQAVIDSVDYVNVMTYIYSGGWNGQASHASNLYAPTAYEPQPDYSVDAGMRNLLEHRKLPPEKLLLGVTFWASQFSVPTMGAKFPSKDGSAYCTNITYADTIALLQTGQYLHFWDEGSVMPFIQRANGVSVVSYEDAASIRRKCDYAKQKKLAGVMIWHLGADLVADQSPLMDAIGQSFGVPPKVFPRSAIELQVARLREKPKDEVAATISEKEKSMSDGDLRHLFIKLSIERAMSQDEKWMMKKPAAAAKP